MNFANLFRGIESLMTRTICMCVRPRAAEKQKLKLKEKIAPFSQNCFFLGIVYSAC